MLNKNSLYLAWFVSLFALAGSLYFSEVLQYAPCVLCWWERIFFYPLAFILPVGIIKRDANIFFYAVPLVVVGFFIALYHNLLYYNFISEAYAPCATGVSCITRYINWLGFIDIPLLSLAGFTTILALLIINKKSHAIK